MISLPPKSNKIKDKKRWQLFVLFRSNATRCQDDDLPRFPLLPMSSQTPFLFCTHEFWSAPIISHPRFLRAIDAADIYLLFLITGLKGYQY